MHAVAPSRGFPACYIKIITVDKSGRALLTKLVTSSVAT